MRILITASGGGHTAFAATIGRRLRRDHDVVFVVRKGDSNSRRRLERLGEVIETTSGRGPRGSLASALPRLAWGFLESLAMLRDIDVVVCTGHNHSLPPTVASYLKGSRVYVLEDIVRFTSRGRAARIASWMAETVYLHWPEQANLYPSKGYVVGPVYEDPEVEPWDGGYILVTAGTYGYRELFDAVSLASENLGKVVLQTGEVDPRRYEDKVWKAFDYTMEFHLWIAGASVVVAHQAVTPVTAALAYSKPVVIVPNPDFRLAASPEEARVLARKIGAVYLKRPTPEGLTRAIQEARNRRPLAIPNGADNLVVHLLGSEAAL